MLTLIWVLGTWWIGLPLVFLPLSMGPAIGLVTSVLSRSPRRPQALFAAGVALVHGLVGSVLSTITLAVPPEKRAITHAWTYLQDPGRLGKIILHTLTPSDVLIYSFIAGTAYAMVLYVAKAKRKTGSDVPTGEPLAEVSESEPDSEEA